MFVQEKRLSLYWKKMDPYGHGIHFMYRTQKGYYDNISDSSTSRSLYENGSRQTYTFLVLWRKFMLKGKSYKGCQ